MPHTCSPRVRLWLLKCGPHVFPCYICSVTVTRNISRIIPCGQSKHCNEVLLLHEYVFLMKCWVDKRNVTRNKTKQNLIITLVTKQLLIRSSHLFLLSFGRNHLCRDFIKKESRNLPSNFHFIQLPIHNRETPNDKTGSRARSNIEKLEKKNRTNSVGRHWKKTDGRSGTVDVTRLESEYMKDKARAKSNFSCSRNLLLSLLEHLPEKKDMCLELAIDFLKNLSESISKLTRCRKTCGCRTRWKS